MKLVRAHPKHGDLKLRYVNATFFRDCMVTMPWMTSANCERLPECAKTRFKKLQANSSNIYKNCVLVQSSKSAVLKFLTA